jgi:hypothetical protein
MRSVLRYPENGLTLGVPSQAGVPVWGYRYETFRPRQESAVRTSLPSFGGRLRAKEPGIHAVNAWRLAKRRNAALTAQTA